MAYIAPYYPSGKRGRPPKGIEKMLRMYLLQCWFNLSDEGVEDAIYNSYAMRKFVGIDFFEEDAPDATTLLKFRRLLEKNNLNKAFFEAINRVMVESGHIMRGGTIVDATIINAPSSTKNAEKKRNPEMHQTKKGNEWRFGMKCHVGVDAGTGLVHTIEVTPANTHDITVASKLIRSDDEVVYGDSGFVGIQKRPEIKEKKYSFSAGQYFEVKIEYVNLTPAEFAEKMQGFQTRLQAMFEEGHRLEQEIKEQLGRVKYE